MKYKKNKIIHFMFMGSIYMNIEVIFRIIHNALVGILPGVKPSSLMGYTSLWMFLVAGIMGILIGYLNDFPNYYDLKVWQQMLIGGTIISFIEFLSGCIFNIYFSLNIWDYSNEKYNLLGQICLTNCILWYLLTLIIIWLDDNLTCYIYNEGEKYSLLTLLKKLITNK